jgi:hypothetical protein
MPPVVQRQRSVVEDDLTQWQASCLPQLLTFALKIGSQRETGSIKKTCAPSKIN